MSVEYLGFLAGTFMIISFVPQVLQVVKTKSTKDISLLMYIIFSLGILCWLVYGFLLSSYSMVVSNSLTLILALIVLGYKLKYK